MEYLLAAAILIQLAGLAVQWYIFKSLKGDVMATKQQVLDAIEQLKTDIPAAVATVVETVVTKETAEIVAQIEKIKQQPGGATTGDLDNILNAISGAKLAIVDSISKKVSDTVDKISVDDGGDQPTQQPPNPNPNPQP